jgi:hypothetical protein
VGASYPGSDASGERIDQITATPNIRIRPFTVIEAVEGAGRLERFVRCVESGESAAEERRAVRVHRHTAPQRLGA